MNKNTIIVNAGRDPFNNSGAVNTPINRTSTVLFPSLKDYFNAEVGKAFYGSDQSATTTDYSYGISGGPTSNSLSNAICEFEGADHCFVCPSGLNAIVVAILAFVKSGDHILISDNVYGPTRRFCYKELSKFGIETTYFNPEIGSEIESLVQKNTKVIFTETPGSLTFEVQDIPAITKIAKKHGIISIIDNSWATSYFFDHFKHGVDIAINAGTKYISGHSDILIGLITCKEKHKKTISKIYQNYGIHTSPDSCYLASRGLRTIAVRLKQHQESALEVASYLNSHKKVNKILHPALPSCPGHQIFKRDFTGSSGLFSIILDNNYSFKSLAKFIDSLKLFGIGASWGGFESLALSFDPTNIRTAKKWTEKNSCIRLHIGLEDPSDLIKDLEQGLKKLK